MLSALNAVRRRVYKFFHYKITPQLLQNLFNHFKKVLDEIIQRNGDWTDIILIIIKNKITIRFIKNVVVIS